MSEMRLQLQIFVQKLGSDCKVLENSFHSLSRLVLLLFWSHFQIIKHIIISNKNKLNKQFTFFVFIKGEKTSKPALALKAAYDVLQGITAIKCENWQ